MNTISIPNTRQPDFCTLTGLSPIARLVALILDRTPRRFMACIFGNERLAAAAGCSVRTLERAFAELASKGLIAVVRDYALAVRRRIELLWRTPDDSRLADAGVPEAPAMPAALPEAAPAPEPEREDNNNTRKATPEEIDKVVKRAESHYCRPLRDKVLAAAKEHRLSLVDRALDVAEEAASYSFRFVEGILNNWRTHPPQARRKPAVARLEDLDAEIAFYEEWKRRKEEVAGG